MQRLSRETKIACLFFAALLAGCATRAEKQQVESMLSLNGGQEVPFSDSTATGNGQITVAPDHSVSGSVTVTGFMPTMAHIHVAPAGKAGKVIIPLVKSGDDSFTVPAGAKLTDEQYAQYLKGNLYVNVHSAAHPAGEVRAQITPPKTGLVGY